MSSSAASRHDQLAGVRHDQLPASGMTSSAGASGDDQLPASGMTSSRRPA